MSGKNKLIRDVTTKEEFQSMIESEHRLLIVDLYDTWYGPCVGMEPTFKSLAASTDYFEERGQVS
jgi:thioredoxin-like negative regulator of GroEL